jgi:chemotaxis protein MotA
LVFGAAAIVICISLDGNISDFINIPSVFIVFGGVIASTVVSYPLEALKNLGKLLGNAFKQKKVDFQADIENIVKIANIARREGILALEESVGEMNDPFMQKGIMLIIDGSDPELVKSVMETELVFIRERHGVGQAILLQMSSFSPAYGMIGTLVGLINMLQRLDDPSTLGPSMAVALVTTFYGVVLANLLFTPIAKKLGAQSGDECLRKEMMLEGILSIQDGENPRIIREKLNAFLPHTQVKAEAANTSAEDRRE